jgi:hypothetical protein
MKKRTHPTTEIMESQFGPVWAEVLSQTNSRREVLVKSQTGQVLEHAIVEFDPAGGNEYPEVDQRIRDGALIGQVFREAGVEFERREKPAEAVELTDEQKRLFDTDESHGIGIEADILVGPNKVRYAHNVETYSPALNWPE